MAKQVVSRSARGAKIVDEKVLLSGLVDRIQRRWVQPHCRNCSLPCCTLQTLVLELDWRRLKQIWGIRQKRSEFDRDLREGRGPDEIRQGDGFYYAHQKVCPAYRDGLCSVYDSPLKPTGCSDFPLYLSDGGLVADLRCEALQTQRVEMELNRVLAGRARWRRCVDSEFPFLITYRVVAPDPPKKDLFGSKQRRSGRRV